MDQTRGQMPRDSSVVVSLHSDACDVAGTTASKAPTRLNLEEIMNSSVMRAPLAGLLGSAPLDENKHFNIYTPRLQFLPSHPRIRVHTLPCCLILETLDCERVVYCPFDVNELFPAIGQGQRLLSWVFVTFLPSCGIEEERNINTCWIFDEFELPRCWHGAKQRLAVPETVEVARPDVLIPV